MAGAEAMVEVRAMVSILTNDVYALALVSNALPF